MLTPGVCWTRFGFGVEGGGELEVGRGLQHYDWLSRGLCHTSTHKSINKNFCSKNGFMYCSRKVTYGQIR